MSNDNELMMKCFLELHNGNPREGPGDNKSTLRAVRAITDLPANPRILDVGCGPGMQTFCLEEATGGEITALDYYQQFLDQLEKSAADQGIEDRIKTIQGSMFDMPFENEAFDLIWSEGAIYIIGFGKGLREWGRFLRPGGVIAVTHISYFRKDIPEELENYWNENYPGIATVEENIKVVEESGYELIDHFSLPESAWWNGYYDAMDKSMEEMKKKYPDNEFVAEVLRMEEEERQLYRKYSEYYGYEFFVMRKV